MVDFAEKEWRIDVMDSTRTVETFKIAQNAITDDGIKRIMELLAARNLTPDEIIGSAQGKASLLEVHYSTQGKRPAYWSGQNPHYLAGLFGKDE